MSSSSYNSSAIGMIIIHCCITLCLICLKLTNSNPVPDEILKVGQYSQPKHDIDSLSEEQQRVLLNRILHYSQSENLLKPEFENTDYSSYSSIQQFRDQNMAAINDAYLMNEQICSDLDLQSQQCYEDCIPYLSPIGLLLDNTTEFEEILRVLGWYQMVCKQHCNNAIIEPYFIRITAPRC